jgi:hypothetical protein
MLTMALAFWKSPKMRPRSSVARLSPCPGPSNCSKTAAATRPVASLALASKELGLPKSATKIQALVDIMFNLRLNSLPGDTAQLLGGTRPAFLNHISSVGPEITSFSLIKLSAAQHSIITAAITGIQETRCWILFKHAAFADCFKQVPPECLCQGERWV